MSHQKRNGMFTDCCAKHLFGFFLTVFFAANVSGQSGLIQRSDSQQWTEIQFAAPLNGNVDFNLLAVVRVGRDVTRPVDERVGVGFSFRLGKYLIVSPNYLHIATQPLRDLTLFENRLSVPLTIRFPVGRFRLSDRSMFERRLRHPGRDSTRYRNKLQIEHAVGAAKLKLSAFIADEVFYDWNVNLWVRNRIQLGVSKVVNKHFTTDFYYLRQNDSHSIPGNLHVVGITLRARA